MRNLLERTPRIVIILFLKSKVKVVHVRVLKVYGESRGIAPFLFYVLLTVHPCTFLQIIPTRYTILLSTYI